MKEFFAMFAVGIAFFGLVVFAANWGEGKRCEARWADSGLASQYSMFSECRVEVAPGVWIPENAIKPGI